MLLRTLGTFELLATGEDGQPIRVMGPQKPLAMLAYVALAPDGRVSRDHLIDLLWQNLEPERARRTLRQSLFSLRQKLGDVLVTDGEYLRLAAPIASDCRHFEAACAAGQLEDAWHRYTGHFIADFASSGSAPFEHWCDRQRERLRASWLRAGEALVRSKLTGAPRDAAEIAARLRDDDPSRTELWLLRIRALMLAGDWLGARAEAQQLERRAEREGWRLDDEFRRVRAQLVDNVPPPSADVRAWRRPDLVGRETAFASLLTDWAGTVHAGTGTMVVVRGSPGIGKTMLLDEFSARARGEDGHVLVLRARRVNADTPYALVAALADQLADLPGALGVSPASAAILVELSPALSAVFRSATPRSHPAAELLRLRTQALVELLVAVTDEQALLLCIDDLHWADEPSRQILANCGELVDARPLMLVLATRRTRRWVAPESARYVDLPPLSLEQVELLVTGVAEADAPLLHEIAGTMMATSGGVPLLVVSALELCLERHLLSIEQDQWRCASIEAFRRAIGQGGVLEKLLAGVSPTALNVLTALAVAEGALSEPILADSVLPADGAAVLDELVSRGLVVHGPAGIEIAHDELAEAALAIVPADERRAVMRRVGRALLAAPGSPLGAMVLAGRLLANADDDGAAGAFARWLEVRDLQTLWRDPMRAAADFLGSGTTPHELTRLARSVPFHRRLSRGHPRLSFSVALVTLLLVCVALFRGGRYLEPEAMHIVIAEPVNSDGFIWSAGGGADPITIRAGAVFTDARRLPTSRTPDSATVAFESVRGQGKLLGTTTREVVDGRVQFDDLRFDASVEGYLVVRAGSLPPSRSRRLVILRGNDEIWALQRLQLAASRLNGQPIDSANTRIVVPPGVPITGTLRLYAVTTMSNAAVIAGAVGLWGDRRTNFLTLTALPPHGQRLQPPTLFVDAGGGQHVIRAPTRPGRYHLLIVYRAETAFEFVASSTNWLIGRAVWNDGNDLADLTAAEVERLRRDGLLERRILFRNGGKSATFLKDYVVGTVIDVVVQP